MPETTAAVALMPGNLGTPVLAPLYADGMPLAALGDALAGTGSTTSPARFWSTPARAATDATREVLEISLGAARTVNTVAVSLPRFPHTSWLQAFDEDTSTWFTLADAAGNPAAITFTDSLPPVISVGVTADGRRHPAHHGAGHWVPVTYTTTPTTCSRLRLVQVRIPTGAIPLTAGGTAAAYPLGARDLIAGYATDTPGGEILRAGPVAVTADILGSAITHTLHRYDAWALPAGATWRSAPAASPAAVVGLYLDCRDALGNMQAIDRLSLDPITSGVSMCVYYATDVPTAARFPTSDAQLAGVTVPSVSAPTISAGALQITGASCYLDVAANAVGLDPAAPWSFGIAFTPTYASTAPGPYTLLDAGGMSLSYASGAFTATAGTLRATVAATFTSGTPLVFTAVFDGTTLTARTPTATSSAAGSPLPPRDASIRIGGALGATPASSDMAITALAIWQCSATGAATGAAQFLSSPASVMDLPLTDVGPHPSDGVVLRLDPRAASADNPDGLFGAPGMDVGAVAWSPLAVDAVARSGALALPPIAAKLIKIEFTNLAPLAFETTSGTTVAAPLLAPDRQQVPSSSSAGSPDAGTAVLTSNGADFYSDMRRLPAPVVLPVSPTEALYAPDPRVAAAIDDSPGFGFTPWQATASAVAPRVAGVHQDASVQALIAARAAFGVALAGVSLGRYTAGAAPLDYERLVEHFADGLLLGPTGGAGLWERAGGRLLTPTPAGGRRVVTSTAYVTHHPVVAVQFAATCSDATSVITDADFTGVDLSAWTATGDATLGIGAGYASAVGHAATVTRHGGASGGIASAQVFTPGRTGRLHGAARIYAPAAATAPWRLALVNGDATVLAFATATPGAGQVVEFTCSLNLDVPLAPGTNTWGTYDGAGPWSAVAAHGTWAVISGAGVWVHNVTVQLQQTGTDADLVYVDSLDLFYDPITWEVSPDGGTDWFPVAAIRNDPAGVLVFPPTTAPATSLMWRASCDAGGVSISAVALRPWYELREGGVRPLPPGIPAGPALSPADHYGPIAEDPMWQAWHRPVPRSWWAGGRPF